MRISLYASILILAACAPEAEPPADGNVAVAPRQQTAPAPAVEPEPAPSATAAPASEASATTLELTIPEPIRGKWRESAGNSVTAAQCALTDYENATRTLTVRADGFTQFETGGRLLGIAERGNTRIRATFDTTYADEPTQGEYIFEVQDGGQTLIVRDVGANGRPGPIRHRRCPA